MSTPAATAALAAVIGRRIDFPTWLPPMLVKELREGLRTRGFVGTLVGFQVVMTVFLIFAVAGGSASTSYGLLQGAFWVTVGIQLLLVTPARALAGLRVELDSRWVDLLMLTRLTAWRVVLGKWISLLGQSALVVFALLPYGVARYFFGSVDLVGEGATIAWMFLGSAVLTAAALWSSALPKIARIGIGLAVLLSWQTVPFVGFAFGRMGPGMVAFSAPNVAVLLFDALIVLGICLVGAVRRLAPKAETPTGTARLLPWLALLPTPFLRSSDLLAQLGFTALVIGCVGALEMARGDQPMAIHWRRWSQRGTLGRIVARFVQPGWASAMEWVLLAAAVAALGGLAAPDGWKIGLVGLHGAVALIFPALLLSWASRRFTQRAAGYWLVLGAPSLLAAVASAASGFGPVNAVTDIVFNVLPISAFWATLTQQTPPSAGILAVQITVAVVVLALAWWRAAPYRRQRIEFDRAAL